MVDVPKGKLRKCDRDILQYKQLENSSASQQIPIVPRHTYIRKECINPKSPPWQGGFGGFEGLIVNYARIVYCRFTFIERSSIGNAK